MNDNDLATLVLCGVCCIYPIASFFVIDTLRRFIVEGRWRNIRNRSTDEHDE